ncbi:unnamed protein product [Parajaminaea phylloscopi]
MDQSVRSEEERLAVVVAFVDVVCLWCEASLSSLSSLHGMALPDELVGATGGARANGSLAGGTRDIEVPEIDALLLLESPFARMPYEDLRRRMRVHQRIAETHFAALTPTVKDLETAGSRQELAAKIGSVIERVKAMRDKLNPLTGHLDASLEMLQKRTAHLAELHEITSFAAAAKSTVKAEPVEMDLDTQTTANSDHTLRYQVWSDTRLHRMIIDWLLRRGYVESAQTFIKSRGIEAYTDLPVFKELFAIRASLIPPPESGVKSSCAVALAWCLENKVALRRFKSTLEFELRMQEFIDLCKTRTPESLAQGVAYLRKHILPLYKSALEALSKGQLSEKGAGSGSAEVTAEADGAGEDSDEDAAERAANAMICERVSRIMGLLAVGPGGWAYEEFYSPMRYSRLYESLLSAALHIYSLPPQPLLHIALSAGLSSLKVPACYGGEKAPTSSATPAGNAAAAATATSAAGEAASSLTESSAEPGEIDEDLMRDVRREVRAEHIKHEAEGSRAKMSSVDFHIDDTRNIDCPVCATVSFATSASGTASAAATHHSLGLGVLAREVPWSHHSNSVIVCRISGKVIDDSDEGGGIVALPNGRVYSKRALEEASAAEGSSGSGSDRARFLDTPASSSSSSSPTGFVTCPRTRTAYPRSSMRKVYIS